LKAYVTKSIGREQAAWSFEDKGLATNRLFRSKCLWSVGVRQRPHAKEIMLTEADDTLSQISFTFSVAGSTLLNPPACDVCITTGGF